MEVMSSNTVSQDEMEGRKERGRWRRCALEDNVVEG